MPRWELEVEMSLRLLLATALGAIIGYQRERAGKPAGLRTHVLICVGAALFTIASIYGFAADDTARVAAGVVAGVGFLGAGAIIRGWRRGCGWADYSSYYMGSSWHWAGGRGRVILGLSSYHSHHINCIISASSYSMRARLKLNSLVIPKRGNCIDFSREDTSSSF